MRTLCSALLVGVLGWGSAAWAISGAAPAVGQTTKVTWGRISRIEYPHEGNAGMRIHLATPSGDREFDVPADSVPVRDMSAQSVGFADALRVGEEVRVYYSVGPNGETVPIEFTAEPPGPPGP